jgi:hypothetical protein
MVSVSPTNPKNGFTVKAYQGDNKTLLAFNFDNKQRAANLAGFSIQAQPPGKPAYFLFNDLQFATPNKHAVMAGEKPPSSANAPFQKYRWTHFTGQYHQGLNPAVGPYKYTVTPRYFDNNGNMLALDNTLSASLTINVGPFRKGPLSLGFTRGYMQSQAYVNHFGAKTPVIPPNRGLQYATSSQAGTNNGQAVTFDEIYDWMGESARVQVFGVLNEVLNDPSLTLDMFAYDLDEPNVVNILFTLAKQGRIRLILDNAALHVTHTDSKTKKTVTPLEVPFADQFEQKAIAPAALLRGKFGRYSHDKILIVLKNGVPQKVLTGSTNFSVTGLYVNANHVLVFDDPGVAHEYEAVFEESWNDKCSVTKFSTSSFATAPYNPSINGIGKTTINFSPHSANYVTNLLGGMVTRINSEAGKTKGNVLFAVMELDDTKGVNPVYTALNNIYKKGNLFSYGISDRPDGVELYQPATPQGVLVTGKPSHVQLPPPFNQVPTPPGHEIHDKFVVCGINGNDPVVYCGSSNLANGGEQANGDNLLEIHDADIATAFAIEALGLIDHYNFLDRWGQARAAKTAKVAAKKTAAKKAPAKTSVPKKATKVTAKKAGKTATKRVTAPKAAKKSPRRPAAKKAVARRAKKK